jgi:hypothetical protein
MAEYTADRLQIEIESSAQNATDSVNELVSALERLKGATKGFKNPIGSGAKTRSAANSLNAMKKKRFRHWQNCKRLNVSTWQTVFVHQANCVLQIDSHGYQNPHRWY